MHDECRERPCRRCYIGCWRRAGAVAYAAAACDATSQPSYSPHRYIRAAFQLPRSATPTFQPILARRQRSNIVSSRGRTCAMAAAKRHTPPIRMRAGSASGNATFMARRADCYLFHARLGALHGGELQSDVSQFPHMPVVSSRVSRVARKDAPNHKIESGLVVREHAAGHRHTRQYL